MIRSDPRCCTPCGKRPTASRSGTQASTAHVLKRLSRGGTLLHGQEEAKKTHGTCIVSNIHWNEWSAVLEHCIHFSPYTHANIRPHPQQSEAQSGNTELKFWFCSRQTFYHSRQMVDICVIMKTSLNKHLAAGWSVKGTVLLLLWASAETWSDAQRAEVTNGATVDGCGHSLLFCGCLKKHDITTVACAVCLIRPKEDLEKEMLNVWPNILH